MIPLIQTTLSLSPHDVPVSFPGCHDTSFSLFSFYISGLFILKVSFFLPNKKLMPPISISFLSISSTPDFCFHHTHDISVPEVTFLLLVHTFPSVFVLDLTLWPWTHCATLSSCICSPTAVVGLYFSPTGPSYAPAPVPSPSAVPSLEAFHLIGFILLLRTH